MLLCHRTPDRSHYPDVWDLPGGRVEPGESPLQALTRELKEELGVEAHLSEKDAWRTLTYDRLHLRIYLIDDWTGEPNNTAPDEHDEIMWAHPGELADLDLAHSSYRQILDNALT